MPTPSKVDIMGRAAEAASQLGTSVGGGVGVNANNHRGAPNGAASTGAENA